jgi:hypothetical protein
MNYFDIFPKLQYEFSTGIQTIPDIFSKVAFTNSFLNSINFVYTEKQDIVLRPELVSTKKYSSFDYYWLLLLLNNIYDVNRDWPKEQMSFGQELDNLKGKKVYYLYENADILPYDILWADDSSYGVIESWDPSYKELVIKQNFNLPTNTSSVQFNIKRVNSDETTTNIKNYCSTEVFTSFGVTEYRDSIHEIKQTSTNKNLNPFLLVENGNVTNQLLIDTCEESDKLAFMNSLIFKVVNNQSVNGIYLNTKEDQLIKDYSNKLDLYLIQPNIIGTVENKVNIMITNKAETANNIVRIG